MNWKKSAFLGYMQEEEEREQIIRKLARAYARGQESCHVTCDNYFSPAEQEEMKQEAIRRVETGRY